MSASPVQLECYRPLVAKEAWQVWQRLPAQTKQWIGIDDMIESGMTFAWSLQTGAKSFESAKRLRWRRSGGASFGFYLKNHLFYYFDTNFIGPYQESLKRCGAKTVSIDALAEQLQRNSDFRKPVQIEALMAEKPSTPLMNCMVVQSMLELYRVASPALKSQMNLWFLTPDKTKIHTSGKRFKSYRDEFRTLARQLAITYADCSHLLRNPICLDIFSRDVNGIPYMIEFPTPEIDRCR